MSAPTMPDLAGHFGRFGGRFVPEALVKALDTELAAAPFGPSARALVVGRPGGPAFRPSELARLTHLAGIVTTVLGSE